ncbi:MAG: hypothetical protein GXP61_10025, partial [Epsilonproteobacteria bacterium]|nr:hypothetical protein [Campylobacterota bacterium]
MQTIFQKIVKKLHVNSLSFKIVIWFLFLSLVPLTIFALHTYKENSINIKRNIVSQLTKYSLLKQKYIQNWFNFRFADITSWSQSIYTVGFLSNLSRGLSLSRKDTKDFIKSKYYDKIVKKYESNLLALLKNYNYVLDIFLIDKKGDILYTVAGDKELGANILKPPYNMTQFSIAYKKTVSDRQVHFSDVETSKISKNTIVGYLTAPLNDENGKFIGVIALQINLDNIFSMFASKDGYRCYLVGLDGFLRVDISENKKALKYKIDLKPFAHTQKNHIPSYKNSFGEQVIGMHKTITLGDINWILVDEVKQSVIEKDKKGYAVSLFMYLFFIAIIVLIIANYIALQITKPLNSLVKASAKISKGDRNLISSSGKNDEV